jgi:hypothetical protein
MPAAPLTNRHLITIGEVYFQWDRAGRHYLVLDLSGPFPEWVVEVDSVLITLDEYLGRHPGRREEVRQLIRRRLVTTAEKSQP